MAKALIWKDFSKQQLQQILDRSKSHADLRIFAQDKGFSAEKTSTLISIVKANHFQAVGRYYRHYKLYQYAFCPLLKLNVETRQDDIEIPPSLPSLNEAITQEDWENEQERLRKMHEEEEAKRLEDQKLAEEASRQSTLQVPSEDLVSDEVTQKVTQIINRYMDQLREDLRIQMHEQEGKILEKLSSLLSSRKGK